MGVWLLTGKRPRHARLQHQQLHRYRCQRLPAVGPGGNYFTLPISGHDQWRASAGRNLKTAQKVSLGCRAGSGIGIEGGEPLIEQTLVRSCESHGIAIFTELGGSQGTLRAAYLHCPLLLDHNHSNSVLTLTSDLCRHRSLKLWVTV